jgi:hypothetical protein
LKQCEHEIDAGIVKIYFAEICLGITQHVSRGITISLIHPNIKALDGQPSEREDTQYGKSRHDDESTFDGSNLRCVASRSE